MLIANTKLGRQDLIDLVTPPSTATHSVVPHSKIAEAVIESLGFRKFGILKDEYAVSPDGNRMFGVLEITEGMEGLSFLIGVRNSHNKSFALALTVGYRVMVCENLAFHGDFTPVTRRHSKNFDYQEVIDAAVGKMQRHFEPMRRRVEAWRGFEVSDLAAKSVIYDAFIGRGLDAPQHLGKVVHQHYFAPVHPEFQPRTFWALSNAFTSAFHELDPIPRMQATASLAPFLEQYQQ